MGDGEFKVRRNGSKHDSNHCTRRLTCIHLCFIIVVTKVKSHSKALERPEFLRGLDPSTSSQYLIFHVYLAPSLLLITKFKQLEMPPKRRNGAQKACLCAATFSVNIAIFLARRIHGKKVWCDNKRTSRGKRAQAIWQTLAALRLTYSAYAIDAANL